jgi:hypothetical protein
VFVIQKKSLDALKLLFPSRATNVPQSAASWLSKWIIRSISCRTDHARS